MIFVFLILADFNCIKTLCICGVEQSNRFLSFFLPLTYKALVSTVCCEFCELVLILQQKPHFAPPAVQAKGL